MKPKERILATLQRRPTDRSGLGGMTRRRCLGLTALASLTGAFWPWHAWAGRAARAREYHLCLNPQAVLQDPDFPALVARAGVSCVWLAGFFYGHWPWPIDERDEPAVLAWYPSARAALLWNVGSEPATFLVRCGAQSREVRLGGLESALLPDLHL